MAPGGALASRAVADASKLTMATPLQLLIGSCEDAAAHLSGYVEGELRGLRRLRVRLHVALCARCAQVLDGLEATVAALHTLGAREPDASPELARAVVERIRRDAP